MSKRRLENYRLVGELGRGGMSTVHKAEQISLGRTVAIKEIHPSFTTSPEMIARFEREARAIAQLSHPCIVQIYDYIHQDDAHFMVMEFIDGVNLKSILERRGRLSPEQGAAFGVRIAAALAYAHSAGIIHRDIKPSNILLTREGQVKVVDFGIARLEEGEELTRTGAFVGTPAYMSPEQILGERLDGRTDVFSLGVVLYEAVAGEKPFPEDSRTGAASRIVKSVPARLRRRAPAAPRQLERIVMRCLEKQRDHRFGSMSELNIALRAMLPRRERQRPRVLPALAAELQEAEGPSGKRRDPRPAAEQFLATSARRALGFTGAVAVTMLLGYFLWSTTQGPEVLTSGHDREPAAAEPTRRSGTAADSETRAPRRPRASPERSSAATAPSAAASRGPARSSSAEPSGASGFLKLVVRPWAEVRVDGKLYDTTPFESPIPLAPGEHYIELVHETLPARRFTVVVDAGQTRRMDVDLRR